MRTSRPLSEPAAQDGRSPGKDASLALEADAPTGTARSRAPLLISAWSGGAQEERPAIIPERGEAAARRRFHDAALGVLGGCGCVNCAGAMAFLAEPDVAARDAAGGPLTQAMDTTEAPVVALARAVSAGLGASVARIERVDDSLRALGELIVSTAGQMAGVSGALADLRARVEVVEAQPLPGGPAAFASAAHSASPAAEKFLALDPRAAAAARDGATDRAHALEALGALAGRIADPVAQIAVAAELIRLQREAS